jgi:hypothetical protein
MSILTFENVIYKAGYSRRRPGLRPPFTPEEENDRYQWVKEHNPDRRTVNDDKGFNFQIVAYTDETPSRIGE